MPLSNLPHLKEIPTSYLSFQNWLKSHLGTKPSPNTTVYLDLSIPWMFNHAWSHVDYLFPSQHSYCFSRQWFCHYLSFPTISMIVTVKCYITLHQILLKMSIWVSRKKHFPVVGFFWLISAQFQRVRVSCPQTGLLQGYESDLIEREEPKIQMVHTTRKLKGKKSLFTSQWPSGLPYFSGSLAFPPCLC